MDIKKSLLWAGVGATTLTGLISAFIFLFSKFDETEVKLILSTLTIGWFGMTTSLSMRNSKESLDMVQAGAAGIIAILGVFECMHVIWGNWNEMGDGTWKLVATLVSLSFTIAWIAQIRPSISSHASVLWASMVTIGFVVMSETMVLMLIMSDVREYSEMFYRLLATVTVLAVTGSILRPILRKVTSSTPSSAQ